MVNKLVIDSKHRSKGYGTKMLSFIETKAKDLGANGIGLLSGIYMDKAHNFYEKNQYQFRSKWFAKLI